MNPNLSVYVSMNNAGHVDGWLCCLLAMFEIFSCGSSRHSSPYSYTKVVFPLSITRVSIGMSSLLSRHRTSLNELL
jgi:hypothetical protein